MPIKKNKIHLELLFFVALFFAVLPPVAFAFKSITLVLKIQSSSLLFPLSLVFSFFLIYKSRLADWNFNKKNLSIIVVSILSILALSLIFAGHFYDTSFDGQWYHQDAVLLLKRSWNPFYDSFFELNKNTSFCDKIISHYAKSSWFSSSVIYSSIPYIQYAKCFHILTMISSFIFGLIIFIKIFNIKKYFAIPFSFLLAFNPLSYGQSFSFYVDGELASYFLILSYLLIYIAFLFKNIDAYISIIIILLIGYFSNLKFTSAIYSFFIVAPFIIFIIIKRKEWPIWKFFITFIIAGIVSAGLLGYPTYVRNYVSKGHPFYPLMGKDNVQKGVATAYYPANFFNKNRWTKFYLATIAAPENVSNQIPTSSKRIFSFTPKSLNVPIFYRCPIEPISTLGPLNSEITILSIIILLIVCVLYAKQIFFWVLLIPLIFSVIILEDFWELRYVPQLWFIYILGIIALHLYKNKIFKTITSILIFLMLANFIMYYYVGTRWAVKQTNAINKELQLLQDKEIIVSFGWVKSFKERLNENHIKYTLVPPTNDTTFISFKSDYFMNWKYKIK